VADSEAFTELEAAFRQAFPDYPLFRISALTGEGCQTLCYRISDHVEARRREQHVDEPSIDPEGEEA
jgi:putative protein kinase ArgK-like GTPase of G3E family